MVHSFSDRFKTKNSSFRAASSVGKDGGPGPRLGLCVQAIYGIGRVQQPAHLSGEGIERTTSPQARRQLWAMAAYLRAPRAFLKGTQGGLCGCRVHGAVDLLQSRGHSFAVLVGDELQAAPERLDNTGLDRGLREDGQNRLRKALQAIHHGDQQSSTPLRRGWP